MTPTWFRVFNVLVALAAFSTAEDYAEAPVLGCHVRKYQYSAVLTDSHGKNCRGNVSTLTCFGACETYEIDDGSAGQQSCVPETFTTKMVPLLECDEGADQTIRRFQYSEVESCACKMCDTTNTACFSRSNRKDKEVEQKLKGFGPFERISHTTEVDKQKEKKLLSKKWEKRTKANRHSAHPSLDEMVYLL